MFLWVAVWGAVLPFVMNTAGWFLTESGRQPWIVQGIMLTKNGISPDRQHHLRCGSAWWPSSCCTARSAPSTCCLMLRYSREQLPPPRTETDVDAPVPAVLY